MGTLVIVADYLALEWTYYLTKPLMLIIIFIFFKMFSEKSSGLLFRNLMLAGFLFSCSGDILLMKQKSDQLYFIFGLISFLIAHILYSAGFVRDMFDKRPWNQHWGQLAFWALMVVYGAEFFILNRTSFGELYLPVMIYCMAISVMGVSAIMRDKLKNPNGYYKVVFGAIFFIISDSLLATNNFIQPFSFSGPLILGTYFIAQYLIAVGCLQDLQEKESVN